MTPKQELRRKMPYGTISKVAAKAGVSLASVSDWFSIENRESPRIEQAIKEVLQEVAAEKQSRAAQLENLMPANVNYTFITLPELAIMHPAFRKEKPAYNWLVDMLKNCRDEKAGLWISAKCAPDRRATSVDYNSIPAEVKEQYGLPATYDEARKVLLALTDNSEAAEQTRKERARIKALLPHGACKEVAKLAGVSNKSVSAWLNKGTDSERIEKAVRQVLAAVKAEREGMAAMAKELEQ